jgi:glycosyltransferase involved in cell wall biosynthesis
VSSVFSFGSALERKNPYAAFHAFTEAFGRAKDVCLVMKSNGGGLTPSRKRFMEEIEPYGNIRLIDDLWPREDVLGLIRDSDVYLSLHRSEGFGLPIAEAMCLGTPTVVTNWSGNTDFCNESNSFPIDYDMLPVRSRHPEFAALRNLQWADPKIGHAASVLRSIHENRENARARAARCLNETNGYFSHQTYLRTLERLQGLANASCKSEPRAAEHKYEIADHVTPEQPSGFQHQAVEPLHAGAPE